MLQKKVPLSFVKTAIFALMLTGLLLSPVSAAEWTFMVYLDADNNLEDAGIDDFLEMATTGSTDEVNIILQFDRIGGYDTTHGDWTSCKRFRVEQGMIPTPGNALEDLGECNMGDPATLEDFINWGVHTFPANNYAVVLWNHGGGWRSAQTHQEPAYKAVCWDDTNGHDTLYMKEVGSALNRAAREMDLVGFDACLMGMVEVAAEIEKTGASVMVGSPHNEPWDGWPYDTLVADLVANPHFTAAQLGTAIVDRYYQSYQDYPWGPGQTQTAIDLNRIDELTDAVEDLAETLSTSRSHNRTRVRTKAQNVIRAVDAAVIHERHGAGWPGGNGLAIYFPEFADQFDPDYNEDTIEFPEEASWRNFLKVFYNDMAVSYVSEARRISQEYSWPQHVDLYDFCQHLIDVP